MGWTKENQLKYPKGWAKTKKAFTQSKSMLGRHQSDLQKDAARKAMSGNKFTLGKNWKWSDESIKKVIGRPGTRNGVTSSSETRLKQSISIKIALAKRSPELKEIWRAKIKAKRALQVLPVQDTSIEVALQKELTRRGIPFIKHKTIFGLPDLYIEPNICIFADGDYWHRRPESEGKDSKVNAYLLSKGYRIYRFWEKDINADVSKCVDQVLIKKEKS